MSVMKNIFAIVVLLPLALIGGPAYAEYSFQVVSFPEAAYTRAWGINNAGKVVGTTGVGGTLFSFTYDMKKGTYTLISEMTVSDISNRGVMVGDVAGTCAIRDKKGNITTFSPPSWTDDLLCTARGVNSDGKISGYVIDDDFVWLGFIYDPQHDTYEECLPSPQTIAHSINAQGQNVGNVFLFENDAYTGSAQGDYGYLRQTDGSVKYFAINQSVPGESRASGISENGLITGFYLDPDTEEFKSYVTTLSDGNEFETITLADDEVVFQSPCDPDLRPDEGYELFTDITASKVRNDGVVVGSCFDYSIHGTTGELIIHKRHGFIATPIK